jgi:3-oxoacyl-[acyl-carrier protein] reductase
MGNAGQANYCASKAGLIGLTKSNARELAKRSVTVNAVAPGFIATAMTDALSDKVKAELAAQIPMEKLGSADDIANAVVFLASEQSGYITGHVLAVNGGMYM